MTRRKPDFIAKLAALVVEVRMRKRTTKKEAIHLHGAEPERIGAVKIVLLLVFVLFGGAAVIGFVCGMAGFDEFIKPTIVLALIAAGNPLKSLPYLWTRTGDIQN